MTYQITIDNQGEQRIEEAKGIKALQMSLALYRSQGWNITDVSRVVQ